MKSRIIKVIVACGFLTGCGDVASDAPYLSDDIEWVVRIDFASGHKCTGSILSEHWISPPVTASSARHQHCRTPIAIYS